MKKGKIKKIKIGIYDYIVSYKPEVFDEEKTKVFGNIWDAYLKINISFELCELRQKETLLHECLHAIDYYNQIGLSEEQVTALGSNLLELMLNNKSLVKHLIGEKD